jgi:hypothetical protein
MAAYKTRYALQTTSRYVNNHADPGTLDQLYSGVYGTE